MTLTRRSIFGAIAALFGGAGVAPSAETKPVDRSYRVLIDDPYLPAGTKIIFPEEYGNVKRAASLGGHFSVNAYDANDIVRYLQRGRTKASRYVSPNGYAPRRKDMSSVILKSGVAIYPRKLVLDSDGCYRWTSVPWSECSEFLKEEYLPGEFSA